MVDIRIETPRDRQSIHHVNVAAFGRAAEPNLVDELRKSARPFLSFVAHRNGEIIGHISYSPVLIGVGCHGLGLAPMAVLPRLQRQGIGTILLRASLEHLREARLSLGRCPRPPLLVFTVWFPALTTLRNQLRIRCASGRLYGTWIGCRSSSWSDWGGALPLRIRFTI